MTLKIGLIDYDMGNLRSVSKSLEQLNRSVELVGDPARLSRSDLLVLPGVGAFPVAVQNLKKKRLFGPLKSWIRSGKPFLGICLGYQLLFEEGMEGQKKERGLGILKGAVRRFPRKRNLKVPHMGWNQIYQTQKKKTRTMINRNGAASGLFKGIPDGSYFYFVHSYFPVPLEKEWVATTTSYGIDFASSIRRGNQFASQFHPEKSGRNGLQLLKNFIRSLEC